MPLANMEKREALADKYGYRILGWAPDVENPAGITLQSKIGGKTLRFQHADTLKEWEKVLKKNEEKPPAGWAPPKPIDLSKDLCQIPRAALDRYYQEHLACEFIANLPSGQKGIFAKFKLAQVKAREALGFTAKPPTEPK